MGIKEQSVRGMVTESLWYFNEETAKDFFPLQDTEDSRRRIFNEDRAIRGKNESGIPKSLGKSRLKSECSFVVDWQLSDQL